MGYSCKIKSNKEITESEVQEIVDKIPNMLIGYVPEGCTIKQPWGWSLRSDVKLPEGNEILITGSYTVSGPSMADFIGYFIDSLKTNGHEISYNLD